MNISSAGGKYDFSTHRQTPQPSSPSFVLKKTPVDGGSSCQITGKMSVEALEIKLL